MSDKTLVIISTGESEKALTGLMWARNALNRGWMEEVKVIFFGPAQRLVLENEKVREAALEIAEIEKPVFCKFISDREKNSAQIEELGLVVDYVGSLIAGLIKEGYVPLVF
ncbi:MAG: hypothetical protein K9K64_01415 [Desulfohalobiaceae bacterium]|nr:hypothetical protein [Desulfohalobiaceae bacterium]